MWCKASQAQWFSHSNGVNAPASMRHWLTDPGSMTRKLKAHSREFAVRHLFQGVGRCSKEQSSALGVTGRRRLIQREVILLCDNRPVIYAQSSVLSDAMRRDWPFLQALGNVPLGEKLFTDAKVRRQQLQYARLHGSHPMVRRAADALGQPAIAQTLFARRSVFCRGAGAILVTEIFLPAITGVMAIESDIDEFTF